MKIIERLYQYLDYKGVRPTNFEKEIGLSNGYLSVQKKRLADMGEGVIGKIIENCRDISTEWLITGEGEMLKSQVASPGLQTHTIYIDNPDKDEIISLQRDKIKLLDKQLTMTEAKLKQFELLNLEDARFGAALGAVEPTSATSERAIDDFMLRKNQS